MPEHKFDTPAKLVLIHSMRPGRMYVARRLQVRGDRQHPLVAVLSVATLLPAMVLVGVYIFIAGPSAQVLLCRLQVRDDRQHPPVAMLSVMTLLP